VTKSTTTDSALKAAVQALDEELDRFEALADAARRTPLTSERSLEKAATAINQAADSQKRVHGHIQALIDAITAARVKHDQTAEELVKTRDEVQARGERFQTQLARFAALGKEAADISGFVRQLGELKGKPNGEVVAQLASVQERMARVVDGAAALGKEADAENMEDLGRQCDSLKQQVQSALNKVTLLRDKLAQQMS
jgi:DNA repair exonuclease SbcCD ATPase subunit